MPLQIALDSPTSTRRGKCSGCSAGALPHLQSVTQLANQCANHLCTAMLCMQYGRIGIPVCVSDDPRSKDVGTRLRPIARHHIASLTYTHPVHHTLLTSVHTHARSEHTHVHVATRTRVMSLIVTPTTSRLIVTRTTTYVHTRTCMHVPYTYTYVQLTGTVTRLTRTSNREARSYTAVPCPL